MEKHIKMLYLLDLLMIKNAIPQQLTGDNFYIKSNFHGYGGKSYQCKEVNDQIYLIWIDQISKALMVTNFKSPRNSS